MAAGYKIFVTIFHLHFFAQSLWDSNILYISEKNLKAPSNHVCQGYDPISFDAAIFTGSHWLTMGKSLWQDNSFTLYRIFMKLAGNQDNYNVLAEFKNWWDLTNLVRVLCPWLLREIHICPCDKLNAFGFDLIFLKTWSIWNKWQRFLMTSNFCSCKVVWPCLRAIYMFNSIRNSV